MRIPARFVEHPVETLMAGALLLLLLIGSAESGRDVSSVQAATPPTVQQQKM
ncbi:MAG: hypothetical protein H6924_06165 [Alphaproteobacteria bacterium]|nr:hypothetical protein [Alphaproteobacteria bacterium]